MPVRIAVVDYSIGNLRSAAKALEAAGASVVVTNDPHELDRADGVVLPGVGAFRACMDMLKSIGLAEVMVAIATSGRPLLGICIGLQLLFDESQEDGPVDGLRVMGGEVVRFPDAVKVPHMGWNTIAPTPGSRLFEGITPGSFFYFVHSFYPVPSDESKVAARCEYGTTFACAIEDATVFGVQFHPEKSGRHGLDVLRNFVNIVEGAA